MCNVRLRFRDTTLIVVIVRCRESTLSLLLEELAAYQAGGPNLELSLCSPASLRFSVAELIALVEEPVSDVPSCDWAIWDSTKLSS